MRLAQGESEPAPADGEVDSPSLADVHTAQRRIARSISKTPLERSVWLSQWTGVEVFLKLECWQRTRSFKMRGAAHAVAALPSDARVRGLVTASAGNHGQAVALAAAEAGISATIFVPSDAPRTKKARIRGYGAALEEEQPNYDEAERAAIAFARERGALFVHAFSDPAVVAGQGTVGLEILEQLPTVREIIVPVGGGGLIGGIGVVTVSAGRGIRVIGVQGSQTNA
ncbi:MAG: threonine ammonia-lyase, partial [Longimicrobiales bacterium]